MAAHALPSVGLCVVLDVYNDKDNYPGQVRLVTGEVVEHQQGSNVRYEAVHLFKVRYDMEDPAETFVQWHTADERWEVAEEAENCVTGCARNKRFEGEPLPTTWPKPKLLRGG